MEVHLSRRAAPLVTSSSPHGASAVLCSSSVYDPSSNPLGYINMGVAENGLVYDLLRPFLAGPRDLEYRHTTYDDPSGTRDFRAALCPVISSFLGRKVAPDELCAGTGSSALVDLLFFCIMESGESVMIPTPYYSGFDMDLKARSGIRVVEVARTSRSNPPWALSAERLEEAWLAAQEPKPRALLLTSPDNPTCAVLPRETMRQCVEFCGRHQMHLVVDMLFAKSVEAVVCPYEFPEAQVVKEGRVHVLYGFAKDFALGGLRVGVLHTTDPQVRSAVSTLCEFSGVSTDTQLALTRLLDSEGGKPLPGFFAEYRRRLRNARKRCEEELVRCGLLASVREEQEEEVGGIFLWLDLSAFLSEKTFECELRLFQRLLHDAKVYVTPGQFFHSPEPGWFRFCFANFNGSRQETPEPDYVTAVRRLAAVLKTK